MKAWLAWPLLAASASAAETTTELPPPTAIMLRPCSDPVTALKYRLAPERPALIPGNAAPFYYRAIILAINARNADPESKPRGNDPPEDPISGWLTGPLAAIPTDPARVRLQRFRKSLEEIELGVRRTVCDWEFDSRTEGVELLLPEIQELRDLGRLVILSARLAAKGGDLDGAARWIRVGTTLDRHAGAGPTLIQATVGNTLQSMLVRAIEDLIQAEGMPSYYWALASRPRPLIDLARPIAGERAAFYAAFPELRQVDGPPMSADAAKRLGDALRRHLAKFGDAPALAPSRNEPDSADAGPPPWDGFAARLAFASMVADAAPAARNRLVELGRPAAEAQAMPSVQAVALAAVREFERLRDDIDKWSSLPYWQAAGPVDRAERAAVEAARASGPLLKDLVSFRGPTRSSGINSLRVERQLDALQCIEAIRLYAGSHGGNLPPDLASLTDAPAPLDPATGRPFEYAVSGRTATLRGPLPEGAPDHPAFRIRYDLKLVP